MIEINKEYVKARGYCSFKRDDVLSKVTANIPDGYGVFILRKNNEDGDILYIGYSGTIDAKTGEFKRQQLRKRINNKHGKQRRQDFLRQQMKEDSTLQKIIVEWCILDEKKCFPADVKEDLLCSLAQNNRWPKWNKQSLPIR